MKLAYLTLGLFSLLASSLSAQGTVEMIKNNKKISAGIFYNYVAPVPTDNQQLAPEGYKPFYISHFGRHGSRWHTSFKAYQEPLDILKEASENKQLTAKGVKLLGYVDAIYQDALGRQGSLTPRGVQEHRGIAERMFWHYPEVFMPQDGAETIVESRSTLVPRCMLSMAAFNERLKELNPNLNMIREADRRYLSYMFVRDGGDSQYKYAKVIIDSLENKWIHPDRFINSIFKDKKYLQKKNHSPKKVMYDLFVLATMTQDVDYLGIDFYDMFTDQELYDVWKFCNADRYLSMGPSIEFGDPNMEDTKPLLRNILDTAQDVIDGKHKVAATLRFGHDCTLIPFVGFLEIKGAAGKVAINDLATNWNISEISPMAANLQFIFFRNAANDVKVRVLLNEKNAVLPIEGYPFYAWNDFKKFYEKKL